MCDDVEDLRIGRRDPEREVRRRDDRVTLPLPPSTYVDDAARVTFWQADVSDALTW